MASPTYGQQYSPSALSPPYPSSATLPQPPKRRQSDMPSSAPAVKRRKASMLSTTSASSHPLRQTSFPPEQSSQTPRYSRSPSIDTMSLISGTGGGKKKKRKSKAAKDDVSMAGGKTKSSDGKGKRRASRGHTVEDDEDDGPEGDKTGVEIVERTQEEKQKEIEHRALLVNGFDPQQFRRYEAWRSSKLPDAVVRRIVNQTLSQSAPQGVILAVKSVAKMFAGEMIEGARKVQTQWEAQPGCPDIAHKEFWNGDTKQPITDTTLVPKLKEVETRRGPLSGDLLAESFRRYKSENDSGLIGQLGLWQLQAHSGVERFGSKIGGKRLMK